jgi:hypothetical protein
MSEPIKWNCVKDALTGNVDEVIVALRANVVDVTKFFPAKPPNTTSFQIVEIEDDTGRIKVVMRNREEVPAKWKGSTVCVLAHHGDKGYSGVKIAVTNDEKKERTLVVTKAASVTLAVNVQQPAAQTQAVAPPPDKAARRAEYLGGEEEEWPNTATPKADAESRKLSEDEAIKEARRTLWRSFTAMRMALRFAEMNRDAYQEDCGKDLTPEHFRVITSSHYIRLCDVTVTAFLPPKPVSHEKLFPSREPTELDQPAAQQQAATAAEQPEPGL